MSKSSGGLGALLQELFRALSKPDNKGNPITPGPTVDMRRPPRTGTNPIRRQK
jgi:hypothetical protein